MLCKVALSSLPDLSAVTSDWASKIHGFSKRYLHRRQWRRRQGGYATVCAGGLESSNACYGSGAGRAAGLRSDDKCASIRLDNGDGLSASLVVGADGGQSWVRNQCDIGIDYRSYGQRAIVAIFECEKPHHGAAFQWFAGAEGIIALLPLPGRRVSLVWSAPDILADLLLREPPAQLAERLAALPEQKLGRQQPLQPESVKAFTLALIRLFVF